MKAEDNGDISADIFDWNTTCIKTLIKHYLWYPIKRVFYSGASYGGDSIVSESTVAPLFSSSIYTSHPPKISYWKYISLFPEAKMLRHSFKKFLYEILQCFMISLCNNIIKQVREIFVQTRLHSSPLCFTLLRS